MFPERAEFVTILSRVPHDDIGTDKSFADVPKTHWAYNAVQTALAQGWVAGDPSGNFRPNDPISRAEAVTILNRILGRKGSSTRSRMASSSYWRIKKPIPFTDFLTGEMISLVRASGKSCNKPAKKLFCARAGHTFWVMLKKYA